MVTNDNDEIKQKASEKEWDYSASFKDKADDYENYLMNEARSDTAKQIFKELGNDNYLMNEARADTAKKIFKELDEAVWEQIEPSRLEEFYEQFSNAKDLKASLNVATAFSIIGLDAEKYEALKKKYNIEE